MPDLQLMGYHRASSVPFFPIVFVSIPPFLPSAGTYYVAEDIQPWLSSQVT